MADQQPSGRARGRSRGRGRASSGQQPAPTRRPGETAAAAPPRMPAAEPDPLPTPGRGRSRGGSSQVPGSGAPVPAEPKVPPTVQMAALSMSAAGEGGMGGISGRGKQAQLSYQEIKTRPDHIKDKRGTAGAKVDILTNCFQLKREEHWLLYQYHVDFSPMVESIRARQGLLRFHTESLGTPMAFDGMILFLLRRLDQPVTTLQTKRRNSDEIVTITITLKAELAPNNPTCLQVYNIIFRKVLGLMGMQQIGRHYFNPNLPVVIPQHSLQLWPGFITSILQYEEEVMLMADVSHKVLRTDTVLDILANIYVAKKDRFKEEAMRMLVGEIVLTSYNNKTYRVDDIDWDKNPMHTFAKYDGTQISYAQYYKDAYGREIADKEQPLLVSIPKKKDQRRGMTGPIHLIPELCMLTGLSDDVRSDFHVMKDLAQHTRISPDDRVNSLSAFIRSFPKNQEAQDYLNKWRVSFPSKPVKLEGRVMKAENLYMETGKLSFNPAEAEWSRDLRNHRLMTCVGLNDWILMFAPRDQPKGMDFFQALTRVGPKMGMAVQEPKTHQLRDDRAESYVNCIKQNLNRTTQMVVCILPTNRKDRYDAIKKHCCLEAPVPSQCIVARTLSKKQTIMSVATKIAMQINCKMGGELWKVEIPPKKMMVIGIDSYHDSSTKGRSVGGFVATMNDDLTRYYSRCSFQHSGQELIDGLKVCMQAAIRTYVDINKGLPDRVIIYRDGVGDGQLPAVVEHELPQILDTFKALGKNWEPRCAVIVVKKRINNRFFCTNNGKLSNPPPGTIIDSVVTKPEL
ncbi:piwi-like protein 1 [Acanthaster planci]|uniref:Piwi-like protein 1 n=1 Tax=Acanthaster planci TaxID=133434 RepID=A0A8B7ZJR3_ACAPL|nr:piwi-like protein 1 [Acanthaster planci]